MPSVTEVEFYLRKSPIATGWDMYVEVHGPANYGTNPGASSLLGTSDTVSVDSISDNIGQWVSFVFSTPVDFTNSGFYGLILKTTAPSNYQRTHVSWHQATDGKNPVSFPEDTDTETFWSYTSPYWSASAQILYTVSVDDTPVNGATTGRSSPGDFDTWYELFSPQYLGIRSYLVGETTSGPSKPTTPAPANSATEVDFTDYELSWVDGGGATSYDVYIGPVGGLALVSWGQAGASYTTTLNELELVFDASPIDQVIYWRVDASNEDGTTTGDTWSFDARPAKPATPGPAAAATGISLYQAFTWV